MTSLFQCIFYLNVLNKRTIVANILVIAFIVAEIKLKFSNNKPMFLARKFSLKLLIMHYKRLLCFVFCILICTMNNRFFSVEQIICYCAFFFGFV